MADDDEISFQTPEELAAQYGPDSPIQAANDWLDCVMSQGDIRAAWQLTDRPLRRELAKGMV